MWKSCWHSGNCWRETAGSSGIRPHYAAALHISPVYLNEVVKNVTGESVGRYIRNEIVLRAKRMLVYTTRNIGEIACELGFDDYAYFTRLFTKQTGMNPTAYRKKYLE